MTDRASGVRNLRAMFENSKSPASPEPRGRSPADNAATPDGPVRPKSKVRASFVSVEPGKLIAPDPDIAAGTTVAVHSPTTPHRRESFSGTQEEKDKIATALKKEINEHKDASENVEAAAAPAQDSISEEAVSTRESSRGPPPIHEAEAAGTMPNLGSIMKGSDFPEPDPAPAEIEPTVEEPEVQATVEPKAVPEEVHETPEETSEETPEEVRETPDETPEEAHEETTEEALQGKASRGKGVEAEEHPDASPHADAPSDNPDKIVTEVREEGSLEPADLKEEIAASGGETLSPPAGDLHPIAQESVPAAVEPSLATPKPAGTSKANVNGTSAVNGKIPTKKPPTISTTKAARSIASPSKSPLPKSPGVSRLPKTPTTPRVAPSASAARSPAPVARLPAPVTRSPAPIKELPKPTAPKTLMPKVAPKTVASKSTTTSKSVASKPTTALKEPAKAPIKKTSRPSLKPSAATTTSPKSKASITESKKPTSRPSITAPAPKENTATASLGGFKKPKPRSPTRPVRLPSHLTAPTAASAAKHGEEAAAQKLARKSSAASRPAPKTAIPSRKIPSRASLAPSTAPTAPSKRPESRASTKGATDEGFLARMMRPTTASASKTMDKPASPPRRGASVRAAQKPKAHESVVAKGKRKVSEVASKAKDAVTNGHGSDHHDDLHTDDHHTEDHHTEDHHTEDHHAEDHDTADTGAGATDEGAVNEVPAREATPEQGPESSAIELQTPNFESQAIR